jgi:methylmalonyl-CoA/ethylmalonyl-CoA epimerase
MTEDLLLAGTGGPWQIAFVVPALEPAMKTWCDLYGVGPWKAWDLTADRMSDQEIDGTRRSFGLRIALAEWPPVEIELIEPLDDGSIYARSLAAHGGKAHVHHVHCATDDYDGVLARFAGQGRGPVMEGGMNGSRFAYLSTEADIGLLLEFGVAPRGWTFPEPDSVYRADSAVGPPGTISRSAEPDPT